MPIVRTGLEVVMRVGQVAIAVERSTQQRVLLINTKTPAGIFPLKMDPDDYFQLGVAIIRESGQVYDFSEPDVADVAARTVTGGDGLPVEAMEPVELISTGKAG
jgi:hypothetical protein